MFGKKVILMFSSLALVWSGSAGAFRTCETRDSEAWAASTSYTVGELSFDDITGMASGTETIYNYSNTYAASVGECHVTYELAGSYVPGVEVFVLNATRTNFSETCPPGLLLTQYPETMAHNFQMAPQNDGSAVLNSGDNGDFLADGSWQPGKAVFKTGEQCSMF